MSFVGSDSLSSDGPCGPNEISKLFILRGVGGTRWDRPTTLFMGSDDPTPFEVYKIEKRKGWGA